MESGTRVGQGSISFYSCGVDESEAGAILRVVDV